MMIVNKLNITELPELIIPESNDEWASVNPGSIPLPNKVLNIDHSKNNKHINLLNFAVFESITDGAISNIFSVEYFNKHFMGSIVSHNIKTYKNVLNIQTDGEITPFLSYELSKGIANLFQCRIGISVIGYMLPSVMLSDTDDNEIINPYVYICIYDSMTDKHKIYKLSNDNYSYSDDKILQSTQMQIQTAIRCKDIYLNKCVS